MKTRTAPAAALSAAVLALPACGDAGESGGPVTLEFQSLSDQPAAIEATESIVASWNEANPDVQVEIVPAGWEGIHDKLITQFNGGAAPDIIHYEAAELVPFARDGYLADLSEHMSEDARADIPDGVQDAVTVDGEVIAYPTELQSYVVFANRGMLEDAGVEVPDGDTMTWQELREAAADTTTGDQHGLGWGLSSPTAAFMSMAPAFGGDFFEGTGADADLAVGEGEMALPELVGTMAHEDGSILPVTLTQDGAETLAPFYSEEIAMTVQGSFQAANIAADAPDDLDWVVLPPLEGPAGPAQTANPQTLSVDVDSEHVEESAEFLEYFTSTENLAELNEADSLIPATESAREAMGASLGGDETWETLLESGEHLESSPFLFVDGYAQWKETVATPAYQRFLAQEIDADELRDELESGWEQTTE
ncbi:sugar ABC transporter substrate-binding protein [Nocardiopsis sp. HNM0947]|uniref:Sugar ABC transporter substrate-binding protein n=1 Tax=Nocardiopsis coralli TaxID=2772213 RepID=A0ABR9PBP4_9ACTN|nr:sugar ABC transporter substrate-binding protein [Nocardiopsis coralli]MBE3001260.1 sugar ABC transporter substrate-binding protein [Nocardiopsis coralli]